ncbi:UbiA family prenyltransferase [Streptomyces maoxianensis]|uniref:UbiA family prenyltransferase n=1 Tax=Streptomyces maoxianensis TaxID=1459942 RepID=A0ABV9FZT0_9ACTN
MPSAPTAEDTVGAPIALPVRPVTGLLTACHPLPAAAVTAFTATLAAAVGHSLPGGTVTVCAVAAGQLSVGWCNDRIDLRRDRKAQRRDKPLATGQARPGAVTVAAASALALCILLSTACGPLAGCTHLGGVAAAWWYNLHLKRTAASWLPYAFAFGTLPAFVTLALPSGSWPPLWLMAAAALLGTGAHFANVLPDIDHDLEAGVTGLPQRLGRRWSGPMAALLVLASSFVLVLAPPGSAPVSGWAVLGFTTLLCTAALTRTLRAADGKLAFRATMAISGADVVQLLLHGTDLR